MDNQQLLAEMQRQGKSGVVFEPDAAKSIEELTALLLKAKDRRINRPLFTPDSAAKWAMSLYLMQVTLTTHN